MIDRRIDLLTDVLVIGTGIAGVRAAIEAKRSGLEVLIVDKSLLGRASCSIYAGGIVHPKIPKHMERMGFQVPNKLGIPIDKLMRKFLEEGVALGWGYPFLDDQRLMMTIAVELGIRNEELRDFGVKDPYLQHYLAQPGLWGKDILLPMIKYMKDIGVQTLERVMITDLITEEGRVLGALGYGMDTDALYSINARATVLASGGGAQVYERTYSPTRITGDGFSLAYRAGARLWEMELIGWENWFCVEPGCPQWWIAYSHGRMRGNLVNRDGEAFFERYAREFGCLGEEATLSLDDPMDKRYGKPIIELVHYFARASAKEIQSGKGDNGAVLLDLRNVPEELWTIESPGIFALNMFRNHDWKTKPIHIAPAAEKSCGGIHINERCETSLPGLYAAGEVASGSSMPFCLVTGVLAGRFASKYAHEIEDRAPFKEGDLFEDREEQIKTITSRSAVQAGHPREIKDTLRPIMMEYAGVLKSEEGLNKALNLVEQIRDERIPRIFARTKRELREALEAINMVAYAEMIIRSALYRKESRGLHQRADFPRRDDENWLKNILIEKDEGEMRLLEVPVELVWESP
ncbi:MAG: FAD-dependent oxidoreductase [Deltaproteobacteria bacterium]|nr:FAD-dependent oxidoreductase [Deltaproteobacteria bacterium]